MASNSKHEWLEGGYAKATERFGERQPRFESSSGAAVDPIYGPEDLADWNYHEQPGYPGQSPYTRRVRPPTRPPRRQPCSAPTTPR